MIKNKLHLEEILTTDELELLYKYSTVQQFKPNEKIITQGKITSGLYYLLEGSTIARAKVVASGYTTLEKRKPGDFFGEISFMEMVPSPKYVIAAEEVKCLLIPHVYFDFLTKFYPETKFKIYQAMIRNVYKRIKLIHDKITSIISQSDMSTGSHFVNIIHSFTKPNIINFEDIKLDLKSISQFPLFQNMAADEVVTIVEQSVLLEAPKNCTIIKKGDQIPSCYILLHGAIQSSIVHENKTAKLSVIGPGILFANIACIDISMAFDITFITCEKTMLLKLTHEVIENIRLVQPGLWHRLFTKICRSLVALEKSVDKLEIRLSTEIYNR